MINLRPILEIPRSSIPVSKYRFPTNIDSLLHRLAESIPWNRFLGPCKFKTTAFGVAAAATGILLLLVILLFPVFLPLLVFYADGLFPYVPDIPLLWRILVCTSIQ